jgi:hypothetical protein
MLIASLVSIKFYMIYSHARDGDGMSRPRTKDDLLDEELAVWDDRPRLLPSSWR